MKRFFIKSHIKKNRSAHALKCYPKLIKNIGIFYSETFEPDANFITKLKGCFGNKVQFYSFVFFKNSDNQSHILLNNKSFDFLGRLKNKSISEYLANLDVVIDMNLKSSVIKDYALSLTDKSYKIKLGSFSESKYHLIIKLKENQKELFADEIIKYHNILSHAEK
jgi:hypothetical protein